MIIFGRQIIILLLLLLQGLSPLVHAHVQVDDGEYGLHIDGISIQIEGNSPLSSIKATGHVDSVIGMKSAIQQKNLLKTDQPASRISYFEQLFTATSGKDNKRLFCSFIALSETSATLSNIAPRAPPLARL